MLLRNASSSAPPTIARVRATNLLVVPGEGGRAGFSNSPCAKDARCGSHCRDWPLCGAPQPRTSGSAATAHRRLGPQPVLPEPTSAQQPQSSPTAFMDVHATTQQSPLSGIAAHDFVVVTVVTLSAYCSSAAEMAETAFGVGFPKILMATDEVRCMAHKRVLAREYSPSPRLTSAVCLSEECVWPCAYRRVWPIKFAALTEVLEAGLHTLLLDADWRFVQRPFATFAALAGFNVDVVGRLDPCLSDARRQTAGCRLFNLGQLVVRSTAETIAIARRVANRSIVAWDQAVFSEEVSHSVVRRCAHGGALDRLFRFARHAHLLKTTRFRLNVSCDDVTNYKTCGIWRALSHCTEERPYFALAPPEGSRSFPRWRPNAFNYHERVAPSIPRCWFRNATNRR